MYIDDIWIVNSPSNRFADPPTDNTIKTKYGNYLYLRSTYKKARWATLMSDRYDVKETNGLCLEFYYYIHDDISADGMILIYAGDKIDNTQQIAMLNIPEQWTKAKLPIETLSYSNVFLYIQGKKFQIQKHKLLINLVLV